MCKVLLLSHGNLARELLATSQMIYGEVDGIDCISLLPVIGILVLITVANDQLVTMVAAYVLCGELLCVLVSRILNLYYIDVAFVWLGGVMLWLWYWFWLESSHVVMEIVEKTVG